MVAKVRFRILPDGSTEIVVDGAKGSSCEDLTRPFESALGKVEHRERTDAYFDSKDTTEIENES